jgi:hypothetical protein
VTLLLSAGIEERVAVARQRRGKHFSAAKNQHATIEELLKAMFSMRSVRRLYSEAQREKQYELIGGKPPVVK